MLNRILTTTAMLLAVVALSVSSPPAYGYACNGSRGIWECYEYCSGVADTTCGNEDYALSYACRGGQCSCSYQCFEDPGGPTYECSGDYDCYIYGWGCACIFTPAGSSCECGGGYDPVSNPLITVDEMIKLAMASGDGGCKPPTVEAL